MIHGHDANGSPVSEPITNQNGDHIRQHADIEHEAEREIYGEIRVAVDDALIVALDRACARMLRYDTDLEALRLQCLLLRQGVRSGRRDGAT